MTPGIAATVSSIGITTEWILTKLYGANLFRYAIAHK